MSALSPQRPYRLLGSPAGSKKHVLYAGGHFLPWAMAITESTRWMDQQFGPVNRQ